MEGLIEQVDGYCERTDFTYWSEPVNAVTNLAFVIAAWIMWRRVRGQQMPLAEALCAVLAAIGVGSWLFHTHATVWAAIADVAPIGIYILLYIFAANRDFWGLRLPWALLATAGFIPFAAITGPVFASAPFFEVSAAYWPVPLLIALYAIALRERAPETARGLAIGAGILVVSLSFRTVDETVCGSFPLGTHFMWHILNGIMLGWMIEVYRRHVVAARL
ncbi:ceramidase [Aliiruegeria haliotis]|uniref:Ceramidase n=1 Tax=Aliiruegeria haliotis TaxID=1280846 RepID=A0A2T0RR12_9RHOB|nr:ceramidase domain-containing protein [Aliiruegeria haliotis]PRY23608.1 ceramidase [Aliiruegeria haliotis]